MCRCWGNLTSDHRPSLVAGNLDSVAPARKNMPALCVLLYQSIALLRVSDRAQSHDHLLFLASSMPRIWTSNCDSCVLSGNLCRIPQCCGATGTEECCCYKIAFQQRCQFVPACDYRKCEMSCFDCREGKDCKETGCCHCFLHQLNCCCEARIKYACAMPTTLIKCACQQLCCDVRAAFPCDDDV
jgi:hypothetical protein